MEKDWFNSRWIEPTDTRYPNLLKEIKDPPKKLYYRGHWRQIDFKKSPIVAIVGSRQPSAYGLKIAKEWSLVLAKKGVILVSGLALGIDTVVHQSALLAGAATIAVLGCPINQIYPKQNKVLYQQIIKQNGLIVSEFAPGQKIQREQFVTRNRIITGLSKAVVIIEGALKSGTLTTARYAAEQGREVLVLPGQVNEPMAQAPLLLLKQGATPVFSPTDILQAL